MRLSIGAAVLIATLFILIIGSISTEAIICGVIKGTVTDKKTGEPLPSVAVQIVGTTMGKITDPEGKYVIHTVEPGQYSLSFRLVGYHTIQSDTVKVVAGDTTEVSVEMSRTTMETEVVQTCKGVRDVMEQTEPRSSVVISQEQVKAMPVQDVDGIVAATVGVVKRYSSLAGLGPTDAAMSSPMAHGGTTPPNAEPYDAMFFKHYGVNPFIPTEDDRLSTFAVDIDDASYIMARTYLQRGNIPPEEAVRVEEFVNHFDYDYAAPESEYFKIYIDGSPSPFGKGYNLLRIGLKGRVIPPDDRRAAVLTFVVDVSGSMNREDRLGTVRKALRMLVDELREDDLVGIVVYGSHAWTVLEHTSVKNRDKIISGIESLVPEGSTNAEEGLVLGYNLAEKHFKKGAINRVILCSDGVANVGRTGADSLLKRIENQVKKGITLSSIGFGLGNYNDVLLEKLGNKGNGYYAYVDNLQDAKKIFVDNLTGSLEVIARDVKIQVEFDPDKVDRYRLLGFENRDVKDEDFRDDTVDGGEIGSGHSCTALYEIKLKEGVSDTIGSFTMRFKNADGSEVTELSRQITVGDINESFHDCSARYRLSAVAAEFAEIMRGSYWAKESTYSLVREMAWSISQEMQDDADVIEFVDLVSKAATIKSKKGK